MIDGPLRLFGYWRSSAAYRVRIGLNLKALAFEQVPLDLRTGAHRSPDYMSLNPQGLVPALQIGDQAVLTQSIAILEWLEEACPTPPLLPPDAISRALVRGMVSIIACDIHPLNNLRVLQVLRESYQRNETEVNDWIARWISDGFAALERMIEKHGDGFAFGTSPTLVDCHLVPQVFSARRFGVDLGSFPQCVAAAETAERLTSFQSAHPSIQPDATK